MNKIKVRNMLIKDVNIVHMLGSNEEEFKIVEEKDGFWSIEVLENWVNSETDISLIAENKDNLIGFLLMSYNPTTYKAYWENLYVLSEFRNQGIAQKLYNEAELQLKNLGARSICSLLEIGNTPIIKFHEKNKFVLGKR